MCRISPGTAGDAAGLAAASPGDASACAGAGAVDFGAAAAVTAIEIGAVVNVWYLPVPGSRYENSYVGRRFTFPVGTKTCSNVFVPLSFTSSSGRNFPLGG